MIPHAAIRRHAQAEFDTQHVARAFAAIAASLLVVASAGFGGTFALSQASHHGPGLAAFALAMAIGLECAKPFAIEAAFACFRSWAVGRGLAMLLLGSVAVAYSLTAELSLMATTRGDAAAERAKASDATKDDRTELARIVAERSSMAAFAHATAETVTAGREAVASAERARAAECDRRGPHCRARETDEAAARAGLTKAISDKAATDRAARLDAEAATVRARLAAASDPGANALANYLRLVGVDIPAALLSEWLVLVGVLALELGSALAVVLVRAAAPATARTAPQSESVDSDAGVDSKVAASVDSPARTPVDTPSRTAPRPRRGRRLGQSSGPSKEAAGRQIVDALQAQGGRIEGGSVRGIAKLLGVSKSTVHNALGGLIAGGVVAKAAGGALVLTAAT